MHLVLDVGRVAVLVAKIAPEHVLRKVPHSQAVNSTYSTDSSSESSSSSAAHWAAAWSAAPDGAHVQLIRAAVHPLHVEATYRLMPGPNQSRCVPILFLDMQGWVRAGSVSENPRLGACQFCS